MSGRPIINTDKLLALLEKGQTRAQAATHFRVSRAAITLHLGRLTTRIRINRPNEILIVRCAQCDAEIRRHRLTISQSRYSYCRLKCYYTHRMNPNYVPWRQGQRIARRVLRDAGVILPFQCVVHHHDGNNRNNALINLAVFASQSDHLRYHHTGRPLPVWDGRNI